MIEFANVARPRMLVKSLDGGGVEAGKFFAVALRVTVEKMVRKEVDVLAAVTQRRGVELHGIQPKQPGLPETARARPPLSTPPPIPPPPPLSPPTTQPAP